MTDGPVAKPTPGICRQVFGLWFLGIPFWFDFRVQGVDVLPDLLGFALIAIGARRFGTFHKQLPQIEMLSWLLAATSILDVYQTPALTGIYVSTTYWVVVVAVVAGILHSLLVWWMTQVVADFARRMHALDTIKAAESRRLLFFGWQVSVGVALLLASLSGDTGGVLVLGVFFGGIAVLGLLMELMLQARQLCGGKAPDMVPVAAPTGAESPAAATAHV